MSNSRVVGMEAPVVPVATNPLKTLERVKGIELSSSAWRWPGYVETAAHLGAGHA
jgi:hypothetical protein